MSRASGWVQRPGPPRWARLVAIASCLVGAFSFVPPTSRADNSPPNGPPTREQQQLAWDAEKACSGKTFEDAKDHDAFQECLVEYKVNALMVLAGSLGDAIRAECPNLTGDARSLCVDATYLYHVYGSTGIYEAQKAQHRLQNWGSKIERELAAHPRNTPAIMPLAAVPQGQSADPKSTITGIGYGNQNGSQDTGQDYGETSNQDIRGYDSAQQAVIGADGRKVDVRSFMAALQQVSPEAAKNPFVVSTDSSTLTFSPAVEQVLSQQSDALNKVGGVELNVTFQNLALLGVPDMRTTGPTTLIENPVLISLKRLVAAAKPYADTPEHWRKLPEDIRYPGSLGRVHGYVLDPAKGDVFIVGTAAKSRETRLDIDLFTVLMDVVWSKGLVPSISLDPPPPPADFGGPQSARIVNLPTDALVARILLDADYEMKRISFGLVKIADASFKSQMDILKADKSEAHTTDRFWFHPTALNPDSVRVGGGGRVVLHDAGVQVLTEQLDGGSGTGQTDPLAFKAATEFTSAFPRLEILDAVEPAGIFGLLHGITDIVTMYKILLDSEVGYPVLNEFRQLPFNHLTGAEAIPYTYAGLTATYRNAGGVARQLKGGVQLRIRQLRRALDRFEDKVAGRLMRAAEQFEGDGFAQTIPLTFTLAIQRSSNNAALLAMDQGLRYFTWRWTAWKYGSQTSWDYWLGAAIQQFGIASTEEPMDTDAWAYLALANALAGHEAEAHNAITHAQGIDATDSFVRRIAMQIAFMADPSLQIDAVDPIVRRDLSNAYADEAMEAFRFARSGAGCCGAAEAGNPRFVMVKDADFAVKWWPDNPLAYMARGMVHEADDKDAAMRDYNKAIELDPNGTLGPGAARAFDARANLFYRNRDADRAIEDFTQAIRLAPSPEFFRERGEVYRIYKHDYDRALADLTEAININPSDRGGLALEWRAELFMENGQYDLAIQDYTQTLGVNNGPTRFGIFSDRADVYERKGDLDRALADYTEAIRLYPEGANGFRYRGHIYYEKHDYDRAIADYNEAIRLEPKNDDAYNERATVLRAKGDFGPLLAGYDDAIRADPNDASRYRERGKYLLELREFDRAATDYTVAIRLEPEKTDNYEGRAIARKNAGDFDGAIADYTQLIKLRPSRSDYHQVRGLLWESKDDLDRAIADFSEAIRLRNKYNAPYYADRGAAYRLKGDYDLAIADYNKAIEVDHTDIKFYIQRGRTSFFKGDYAAALPDLSVARELDFGPYAILWLYLARQRGGQDGAPEMTTDSARLQEPDWPYPVIELYLGQRSAVAMVSAARDQKQRCEAQFYLGEWDVLHNDVSAAKSELRAAIDGCPKISDAYLGAVAEFKRLSP